MDKKRLILTSVLSALCLCMMGQAKKPTLMVVPSDEWCNRHNYMQNYDNQGTQEKVADYKAALIGDKDLNDVITKIGILMADRGFPLKDLQSAMKSNTMTSAEDRLLASKTNGASIAENPIDRLRRTAKADILLEVNWHTETMGPKQYVTFSISGKDAYSQKQVAAAQGTGSPSFTATVSVLLEEAVQNHLDNFCAQLQNHFEDMFANGREVTIDVRVFENSQGIDLEKEYDGEELTEIIDNWMAQNTVNHRFSKSDATENFILYEQVRIPCYKTNGLPQDTEGFTRELMKFLRKPPYNLPCKILNRGLGRCLLIIGDK